MVSWPVAGLSSRIWSPFGPVTQSARSGPAAAIDLMVSPAGRRLVKVGKAVMAAGAVMGAGTGAIDDADGLA